MKYRAEIDGLRALAVVPVILYHAGFAAFGGGFVGVDVFFVISGYLITSIIAGELEQGRFSIGRFYERRARRILPALLLVMLVCIPVVWLRFLPREAEDFFQSVAAVATFSSNLLFWRESGYFDTTAELKPLLHTWSLAVEEQYYILFPLLLMAFWNRGRRQLMTVLALGFLASFALAEWASSHKPMAGFYLLPARAWELLVGAFIAFHLQRRGAQAGSATVSDHAGSLAGLGLLAVAIFSFDRNTPFPGAYALVPTLGAGLVILCANPGTLAHRLLGSRVPVGIGLISYSAYLWHQPLFAFVRYLSHPRPTPLAMALLSALVLPIAWLSWKYVEVPAREQRRFGRPAIFRAAAAVGVAMIAVGLAGAAEAGPQVMARNDRGKSGPIDDGTATIMLLGDSHAEHLYPGLRNRFGAQVADYSSSGCIPFYDVDRYDSRFEPGHCSRLMKAALAKLEASERFGTVVLATMGPVYLTGETFEGGDPARVTGLHVVLESRPELQDRWQIFEIAMRDTFERLLARGKQVVFVIDVPELGLEDPFCDTTGKQVEFLGDTYWVRRPTIERCTVPRAVYEARTARYRELVRRVARDFPAVSVYDPTDAFCDADWCHGTRQGERLYRDLDHLSEFGSVFIALHLDPVIRATLPGGAAAGALFDVRRTPTQGAVEPRSRRTQRATPKRG